MIKIALPTALKKARLFGETMFDLEKEWDDGTGYVLQRFCVLKGEEGLYIVEMSDGVYGGSVTDGIWYMNLLRRLHTALIPFANARL